MSKANCVLRVVVVLDNGARIVALIGTHDNQMLTKDAAKASRKAVLDDVKNLFKLEDRIGEFTVGDAGIDASKIVAVSCAVIAYDSAGDDDDSLFLCQRSVGEITFHGAEDCVASR